MSKTLLTKAVVELSATGMSETKNNIQGVTSKTLEMESRFEKTAKAVKTSVQAMAVATGGFVGFFSRAAMADTVEGDRLAKTMEYLSRAVGDMFAPVVRVVTVYLKSFADMVKGIDPATKFAVGGVIALVAAGSALAAGFITLLPVLTPIGTVLAAMVSPIGIVVAAVVGLTAAVVAIVSPMVDWYGVLESVVEAGMDVWSMCTTVADTISNILTPAAEGFGVIWSGIWSGIIEPIFGWIKAGWSGLGLSMTLSWKGAVKWIGDAFLGVVGYMFEAINAIGEMWRNTVNKIAEGMTWLGEKANILQQGTLAALREDISREKKFKAFDTDKIWGMIGEGSIALDKALEGNGKKAASVVASIKGGIGQAKQAADNLPKDQGFKAKLSVTFESIGQTFDRLQQAFADRPDSLEKQTVGELKTANQNLQGVIAAVDKIQLVGP